MNRRAFESYWRCLRSRSDGAVALEFALVLPVIVFAFLAMLDVAGAAKTQSELDATIHSAVQVVMETGDLQASQDALDDLVAMVEQDIGSNAAIDIGRTCTCAAEVSCDAACADGTPTSVFVRLGVSTRYEARLLPDMQLTSFSEVRIR